MGSFFITSFFLLMKHLLFFFAFLFLGTNYVHAQSLNDEDMSCTYIQNSAAYPVSLFKTSSGGNMGTFPIAFNTCIPWNESTDVYGYHYDGLSSAEIHADDTSRVFSIREIRNTKENISGGFDNSFDIQKRQEWFEIVNNPWTAFIAKVVAYPKNEPEIRQCFFTGFLRPQVHPTGNTPFSDIGGHFSEPFIKILYTYGVVDGKTATGFFPDDTITRAEAAKIIANSFSLLSEDEIMNEYNMFLETHPTYAYVDFKDVSRGEWFAPYVHVLAANASILDTSKMNFRPFDPISRAEFAKLVVWGSHLRKHDCEHYNISEIEDWVEATMNLKKDQSYFEDVPESSWMYVPVGYLRAFELVSQVKLFFPERSITRGEAAKIVANILNL